MLSPFAEVFSHLRVRYGIKLSLASLLSFYAALALRLEHPNWAVLTALIMMNSHFVGSTAIKAILRCFGTIAGAFLGVWLVGSYASTPVLFLLFIFIILGIAVASQVPYAYYLVGITTLTVATYGIQDPSQAWKIGLNRALEILVGSFSSLAITSLVWPRYAREEFFELGRTALATIAEVVSLQTASYIHQRDKSDRLDQLQERFAQQLSTLRNLLQAGARESTRFYGRLSNYNAFMVSLTNLFQFSPFEDKSKRGVGFNRENSRRTRHGILSDRRRVSHFDMRLSSREPAAGNQVRRGLRKILREAEFDAEHWSL